MTSNTIILSGTQILHIFFSFVVFSQSLPMCFGVRMQAMWPSNCIAWHPMLSQICNLKMLECNAICPFISCSRFVSERAKHILAAFYFQSAVIRMQLKSSLVWCSLLTISIGVHTRITHAVYGSLEEINLKSQDRIARPNTINVHACSHCNGCVVFQVINNIYDDLIWFDLMCLFVWMRCMVRSIYINNE